VSETTRDTGSGGSAARARLTPYELVFTERFEAQVFPGIVTDATRHGVDPVEPDRFQLLGEVGIAVRDVVPAEAPPDALEQYRALLYHAFNFWSFGKRLYFVEPAVARYLVEAAPGPSGWELAFPAPSFYLQLPANLFWGSITPGATPEPVDGFFVTVAEGEDLLGKPFQRISVLMVLGIRRNRAGFSVIPFDTEAGAGIAAEWAAAEGREEGADFESVLPGAEISRLYSILTTREALKLIGRVLWYIDRFPAEVGIEEPVESAGDAPDAPGALPLPHLPYHRVSLGREEPETG
jgi:hypothetical protein